MLGEEEVTNDPKELEEIYRKEEQPWNMCLNNPKFDFSGLISEELEKKKPEYEETQGRDTQEAITEDQTHKPMVDDQEGDTLDKALEAQGKVYEEEQDKEEDDVIKDNNYKKEQMIGPPMPQILQNQETNVEMVDSLKVRRGSETNNNSDMGKIDLSRVPIFVHLLTSQDDDRREQAIGVLGNISGDSPKCRDLVINHGEKVGVTSAGYKWLIGECNQVEEWRHSITFIPSKIIEESTLNEECDIEDDFVDVEIVQMPCEPKVESEGADDDLEKLEKMASYFEKEVEKTFRRVDSEVPGVQLDHAIMNLDSEAPRATQAEPLANVKNVLTKWGDLLKHYLKYEDDEVEVLLRFEEICLESGKKFALIFSKVLEAFYDKDIVLEKVIISWASEKQEADKVDKVFVSLSGNQKISNFPTRSSN
eukprot:Gb_20308 [translate_table: standard]